MQCGKDTLKTKKQPKVTINVLWRSFWLIPIQTQLMILSYPWFAGLDFPEAQDCYIKFGLWDNGTRAETVLHRNSAVTHQLPPTYSPDILYNNPDLFNTSEWDCNNMEWQIHCKGGWNGHKEFQGTKMILKYYTTDIMWSLTPMCSHIERQHQFLW